MRLKLSHSHSIILIGLSKPEEIPGQKCVLSTSIIRIRECENNLHCSFSTILYVPLEEHEQMKCSCQIEVVLLCKAKNVCHSSHLKFHTSNCFEQVSSRFFFSFFLGFTLRTGASIAYTHSHNISIIRIALYFFLRIPTTYSLPIFFFHSFFSSFFIPAQWKNYSLWLSSGQLSGYWLLPSFISFVISLLYDIKYNITRQKSEWAIKQGRRYT